jgi:excisionase family DNA binding protein
MRASDVASLLHIPVSTVHDWARRGLIPSRKIGRHRLYIRQQIEALLLSAQWRRSGTDAARNSAVRVGRRGLADQVASDTQQAQVVPRRGTVPAPNHSGWVTCEPGNGSAAPLSA